MIAILLDSEGLQVARVQVDGEDFTARLLPADFERIRRCRFLDDSGRMVTQVVPVLLLQQSDS